MLELHLMFSKSLVTLVLIFTLGVSWTAAQDGGERPPNFVVIFADDLGYGDLGCFGHPTIATPNLDRMAREGQRWTSFYAAAAVCSPSRAGLLTGRYPIRSGTASGVFFEWSAGGLPPSEITIAELLRDAGYATACIGKWHLGHLPPYLPTAQGFDEYFGIPYSNDMRLDPEMPLAEDVVLREGVTEDFLRTVGNKKAGWVPLMEGNAVIEYPCDQETLTQRYTQRCVDFIESHADQPFFLYYAQTFPHVSLFASDEFRGRSRRGLYGDVVEELDASVGVILDSLRENGLAENTLVFFTSDNGPWVTKDLRGGTAGLLRGAKGETWEGGVRAPAIAWQPGRIEPGVVRDMGSTLDFFATFSSLAGQDLPEDRAFDSNNLTGVLYEQEPSPREDFIFYRGDNIYAVRQGPWKAHYVTQGAYGQGPKRTEHQPPLLFHLERDPGEQHPVKENREAVLAEIEAIKANHAGTIIAAPNQYAEKLRNQELPHWAE